MTSTTVPATARASLSALPLRCRNCGAERAAGPVSICEHCLGPLEPVYEPGRPLPDRRTIAARAPSLWRYQEWLPFDGEPVLSLDSGFTPLVEAPALARRFGVARAWVKNDTVCHPSLSFKDRVVAAAINAAAAFVAPRAGGSLVTKLRKGFEEFLAAGLVRGAAPRLYGAQAEGCAPIVRLVERGGTQLEPQVPDTICRSLAIGNPADGVFAARAVRESGGWAAAVSDAALVPGVRFTAEDTGVFGET